MALCEVRDVPEATFQELTLASWALALAVALVLLARRRNGWTAAGAALLSIPAWNVLIAVLPDMVKTFCAEGNLNLVIPPGQVVPAETAQRLSARYIGTLVHDLGHVLAGALLVARGRDPLLWRDPSIPRIARALAGLLPMGRGELPSMRLAVAWFPALALANLLILAATPALGLRTGDDSAVFANMTLLHVVLVAAAAGVGEELVYRGVMQQPVLRLLQGRMPRGIALALAIAAQAVPFAYAHAGYANLEHLLLAFLFAVLAGIVAQAAGIWAAILLHVLIDFYAFSLAVAHRDPVVLGAAILVGLGVLAVSAQEARRVFRRGRTA
jgi:membrane protease YdiL (CAAX protease family)